MAYVYLLRYTQFNRKDIKMTIVLKSKTKKGYHKIIDNVIEVKEVGEIIKYIICKEENNKCEMTLYKLIMKKEVERIVL